MPLRIAFGFVLSAAIAATPASSEPLTIDDVLGIVSVDKAAPSPDGRVLAIAVQRPGGEGEVAGRTSYEVDPSREDIWLIPRKSSGARNLTSGRALAAGYWCPQWSPDGKHIAMLSTHPEGDEPRGGNSVRLYLWTRNGAKLKRLGRQAMMTMTRYGSPVNALELRGGPDVNRKPQICRTFDENAPFLWLDEHHLLAVQMPAGQNSALFTQYGQALESAASTAQTLRDARVSTVDVSDSDRGQKANDLTSYQAEIAAIDIDTGKRRLLGRVPAFPFRGMLSIVVSPDRKTLAILASRGSMPLQEIGLDPQNIDDAQAEKQFGLIDVDGKVPFRWITLPSEARYPLDLLDWGPDSSALLLRARQAGNAHTVRVFRVDVGSGEVIPVARNIVQAVDDAGPMPHDLSAKLLADGIIELRGRRASEAQAQETWWRVTGNDEPVAAEAVADTSIDTLPPDGRLLLHDEHGTVWQQFTNNGLTILEKRSEDRAGHELIVFNRHLATVDWGAVSTIDYTSEDGRPLKALMILPPGYRRGERYPALVWVYPGTMIRNAGGYWADRLLPGIYNLQLFAAKGYVVLVPSMPLARQVMGGPYLHMKQGVLPAVDRLVELGYAQANNIGLLGQSFGGYATYALLAQTHRFAAAAAIDGVADLTNNYGAFDRGAVGWAGIAQDKSANPVITQTVLRMSLPAYADPDGYTKNSPAHYTAAITTPLLIAHGSLDNRADIGQAETVFTMLDRQGKSTRLLRYQGENHSVSLSPANVRNLFGEIISWFDRNLKESPKAR